MKLATRYLGLHLPHPFLVGASPLVYEVETVQRLEEAGAAAVVMHSLFEEQVVRENVRGFGAVDPAGVHPEAAGFPLRPRAYVEHIRRLKERVRIPVIASLNGVRPGAWTEYARQIEDAGADALELNLFSTPRGDHDSSAQIEQQALAVVRAVRDSVLLPLSVKISPFYTGLPHFVARLEEAGAAGVVLFNSFFQPDIDIEAIAYRPVLNLREPQGLLLRTRWIAALHGRTRLDIGLSGGVHSPADAVKGLMAGATAVQLVSCLLQRGPGYFAEFLADFGAWLRAHQFESVDQLRGVLSFVHSTNVEALTRAGYLRMLQGWRAGEGN